MNQIYECKETRPWKVRYAISFALGAAIAVCVIGAMLAVLAGQALAKHGLLHFLVGVELDELFRADATAGERGVLELLGIAR